MPGDRVRVWHPTRRPPLDFIAWLVRWTVDKKGKDRCIVRDAKGRLHDLAWTIVSFEPNAATIQQRCDEVRRSWQDEALRESLGLMSVADRTAQFGQHSA